MAVSPIAVNILNRGEMATLPPVQLKVNWFPVQVPDTDLRLSALVSHERGDFKEFRHVRQYRRDDKWIAACIASGSPPPGFGPYDLPNRDIPQLTSTLVSESVLEHFIQQGFKLNRGKGQSSVFRPKAVAELPEALTFYEGLLFKPFYLNEDGDCSFGMVIDYVTHQEFTRRLADDSVQQELARQRHEVIAGLPDGTHLSGYLKQITNDNAVIENYGVQSSVPLSQLRLKANYRTVREYMDHVQKGRGGSVVRLLQVESLSLTKSGFANVSRLKDRYERVSLLLGRSRSAGLNLVLPTLCQTVVTLATEPADLEMKSA